MSQIYSPQEDSYLLQGVLKKHIPNLLKKNKHLTVLEIGVGSGIQLQTLFSCGIQKENILGVDINPEAVAHCKTLGFNCTQSNLFAKVKGTFDLIICNPPYLPLEKNEPKHSRIATTGGKKGSELINEFLLKAPKFLNKGGKVLLVTSSLTKGLKTKGYHKKMLDKRKLFFEELFVYQLTKR